MCKIETKGEYYSVQFSSVMSFAKRPISARVERRNPRKNENVTIHGYRCDNDAVVSGGDCAT